jgi:ferredoxin-NADP reductase
LPEHAGVIAATLASKRLLSEASQTWELSFTSSEPLTYQPGQFYSFVTERDGKQEVRAYSLTQAPDGDRMVLCLNRAGWYSNLLCDLETGETVQVQGPYGGFVLHEGPGIILADGVGIAPVAAMVDALLRAHGNAGSLHLLHTASSESELFYRDRFEQAERQIAGFRYLPLPGVEMAPHLEEILSQAGDEKPTAYIVGLNAFAAPLRQWFKDRGWDRKQIVFERYD